VIIDCLAIYFRHFLGGFFPAEYRTERGPAPLGRIFSFFRRIQQSRNGIRQRFGISRRNDDTRISHDFRQSAPEVEISGTPQAIASAAGMPNPSYSDGTTAIVDLA